MGLQHYLDFLAGIDTVKVVPLLISLSTFIFPPVRSTHFLTMESPNPDPSMMPTFFARKNRSNICSCSVAEIPMPASLIVAWRVSFSNDTLKYTWPPDLEYLTALDSRFSKIW